MNNKRLDPFSGCVVMIVGGFLITLLLITAVAGCDGASPQASRRATEGLMKAFMVGSFWAICFALFSKD